MVSLTKIFFKLEKNSENLKTKYWKFKTKISHFKVE